VSWNDQLAAVESLTAAYHDLRAGAQAATEDVEKLADAEEARGARILGLVGPTPSSGQSTNEQGIPSPNDPGPQVIADEIMFALSGLRASSTKTVRIAERAAEEVDEALGGLRADVDETAEGATEDMSDALRALLGGGGGDVSGFGFKDPLSAFGLGGGEVQGGGFLGSDRALEWIKVFQRLQDIVNKGGTSPAAVRTSMEASRSMMNLSAAFQNFFRQFGRIEDLADELRRVRSVETLGAGGASARRPSSGTTSSKSGCNCSSPSTSILQYQGALR